MAEITAQMVSELRARTGAGLMDCKKALDSTGGDAEEAIAYLKKKGIATAAKKAGRTAGEGIIESYIHLGGKVGVMVEMGCESDFVAKNEDFKHFVRDIAMHIAAASPLYVSRDEVPADLVEKEKEIAAAQAEGKPAHAVEKIVAGKIDKWYAQICVLEQPFVKNSDQTVQEFLTQKIATIGENLVLRRFARFQVGE